MEPRKLKKLLDTLRRAGVCTYKFDDGQFRVEIELGPEPLELHDGDPDDDIMKRNLTVREAEQWSAS